MDRQNNEEDELVKYLIVFILSFINVSGNCQDIFKPDNVVKFLQQDSSHYRILSILEKKPPNWYIRFFIQNIYGYHPAKMKNYQEIMTANNFTPEAFLLKYYDMSNPQPGKSYKLKIPNTIDRRSHENFLNMMNVKYVITPYYFEDPDYKIVFKDKSIIYERLNFPPRAWFADKIIKMNSKEQIFMEMKNSNFNKKIAFIYKNIFYDKINNENNKVEISDWNLDEIILKVSATIPGFIVLSEIFYPQGWTATINNKEIEIYQVNHILRGVFTPKGEYDIVFKFNTTYRLLWLYWTIFILFIIGMIYGIKKI